MTGLCILAVYTLGLVGFFRNRYRTYLNNRDADISYNNGLTKFVKGREVASEVDCRCGALAMALAWPITAIPVLLIIGVKTDKQKQDAQKAQQKKLEAETKKLRKFAEDHNIPWVE